MRKHILHQVPPSCTIRRTLKKVILGDRVHCPHCGSRNIKSIKKEERWRCRRCHLPCNARYPAAAEALSAPRFTPLT